MLFTKPACILKWSPCVLERTLAQTGLLVNSELCRHITFGYVYIWLFRAPSSLRGGHSALSHKTERYTFQVAMGKVLPLVVGFPVLKTLFTHASLGGNGAQFSYTSTQIWSLSGQTYCSLSVPTFQPAFDTSIWSESITNANEYFHFDALISHVEQRITLARNVRKKKARVLLRCCNDVASGLLIFTDK